ncbi:peptidoglycan-binding protein [Rhizobium sp. TRM95111]|uniref:glycosyl hydrolase 108 family protein n=1 Tax=Rhizobium alarense TaxID=2846851 RepID=UPI001F236445|nr:glycosyl hydrolase 108 family protein [Rhizobium alarense]MCF3640638.1 peptidoglycan-binding protein [Rhizobium alarense]
MADLSVNANLLSRAARRNGYNVPSEGLVFFGIRGALPEKPTDSRFLASHGANFATVDYQRMRCTLGQWDVAARKVALFPGSTVPSLVNIKSSRLKNGSGTNLLMFGRYEHQRGVHKAGKPNGHRAFRQACFFPVWRTADNLDYDLEDRIDFGSGPDSYVWDNIHSAFSDNTESGYSSAGCQVVCGLPKSARRGNAAETGPWRTFIDNGYGGAQTRFVYLLFGSAELAAIDRAADTALRQVVRYGSTGALARQVQEALIAKGALQDGADGDFGRDSVKALVTFQRRQFGPKAGDGVCGENTAAALGLTLPLLDEASTPPTPTAVTTEPTNTVELEDETDLDPFTLRDLLRRLGIGGPPDLPEMPQTGGAVATTAGQRSADTTAERQPAEDAETNFDRAHAVIAEFEGGYSDHPKDPGGATNFGITHKTLAAWRKRAVSKADVKALTFDEAKAIYRQEYWRRSSCHEMPGPLALVVYNVAVHAGPGTAAKFLQRALNANGFSLKVDGGIGGDTLGAVATAPVDDVISDMIDLYAARLRSHKNYATFKKGFERRIGRLRLETERWLEDNGKRTEPIPTPRITEEDMSVTEQANEIREQAEAVLRGTGLGSQAGAGETQADATTGRRATLAAVLRLVADQLDPKVGTGEKPLTPVNAALGQTVGRLLDGKKSALGIFGALISGLLLPGTAPTGTTAAGQVADQVVSSPLAEILPAAIGLFGQQAAPFGLPISLAMLAWGLLGKLDKYASRIQTKL